MKTESECKMSPLEIIGITGGIGSGKSVVSRVLRLKGYRVYDCDTEAKRLMETDPGVRAGIISVLGEETYQKVRTDDGNWSLKLNRPFIASKIFNDPELRDKINSIVHKAVADDFLIFAGMQGGKVFCETAIIATSGFDRICDAIWLVTAPENERIARVMRRNSLTEEAVKARMETQHDEFNHLPKDKIVEIDNSDNSLLLPEIYKSLETQNNEVICLEKF